MFSFCHSPPRSCGVPFCKREWSSIGTPNLLSQSALLQPSLFFGTVWQKLRPICWSNRWRPLCTYCRPRLPEKNLLCPLQFFGKTNRLVLLHRPFRSSRRSLDRGAGRRLLAPVFDIFSITDPVESLPDFRKYLVDSEMSTRTLCISRSTSLVLMVGTTNCIMVYFLSGLSQARLSNPFSTPWKWVTRPIFPTNLAVPPHLLSIWAMVRYPRPPLDLIWAGRCPFFIFHNCCPPTVERHFTLLTSYTVYSTISPHYCWPYQPCVEFWNDTVGVVQTIFVCSSGFFIWRSHVRTAWSVLIRNSRP